VNRKIYSMTDLDLIEDWVDKWLAFIEFMNNVTGTDQAPDISDEYSYVKRTWPSAGINPVFSKKSSGNVPKS